MRVIRANTGARVAGEIVAIKDISHKNLYIYNNQCGLYNYYDHYGHNNL